MHVVLGWGDNWQLLADSFGLAVAALSRCFGACACSDYNGFGSFEVVVFASYWSDACFDYIAIDLFEVAVAAVH